MKDFKFRMQTVLEQRERVELVAKQNFAEAEAARARGERLLAELHAVRAALLDELRDCHGQFDPLEMRIYQDYMQTITQSIREQDEYVRQTVIQREACKMHMVGAAQNRQALDTLKDRDKQRHSAQGLRREQTLMDDLSTARYIFQRREEQPHA